MWLATDRQGARSEKVSTGRDKEKIKMNILTPHVPLETIICQAIWEWFHQPEGVTMMGSGTLESEYPQVQSCSATDPVSVLFGPRDAAAVVGRRSGA